MITASFDCSDGLAWNRPGFENEFLTSDNYFQILWADRVPAPPKISEIVMSPTDFITSIFEQAQPPRRKDEVKRLLEEWKDTLVLSAWKPGNKSMLQWFVKLQLLASCNEMGFVVVEGTLGITKRPCMACEMTLPLLASELFVSSGSTKPFGLWTLPNRVSTLVLRVIVANLKANLLDAVIRGPPVLSEAEMKAPSIMNRKQNLSDSSYGSVPGGEGQMLSLADV